MRVRSSLAAWVAIGALGLASVGCGDSQDAGREDAATADAGGGADGGGADAGGADGAGGADAGGADGGGIVVITGDTWPDSATGSCADATGPIPCPGRGAPSFGQDGTYRIAVPSYTATAETVADAVTSLMWERVRDGTARMQPDAVAHCEALSLAGFDDWRLPSRLELISLLDHGRTTGGSLPAAFGVPSSGAHWTSSASAGISGTYYVVNDTYGIWTVTVGTNMLRARCVRGGALTGATLVNTETVVDTLTGLEWQRTSLVDTEISWEAALAQCETLGHAGHDDWRLPNLKELATIVDETDGTAPAIDQAVFGTSAATAYWSSSPSFLFPGYADFLQTDLGVAGNRDMTVTASARCVRQAD